MKRTLAVLALAALVGGLLACTNPTGPDIEIVNDNKNDNKNGPSPSPSPTPSPSPSPQA